MLHFARYKHPDLRFVRGDVNALPFPDGSFDFVAAVTCLCCVSSPEAALLEMWRVARHGMLIGLLNRKSLLYRRKAGKGGYRGVRWDDPSAVRKWGMLLDPSAKLERWGTAVFFPGVPFPLA
jgi:SAM-dependent methyltransferase